MAASQSSIEQPPSSPVSPAVTDPAVAQLMAQLADETLPLKTRRQAARQLARLNSDQALAALRLALRDSQPQLKAVMAEALGQNPHPDVRALLLDLARGADETTARGALRGLALRGDADAVAVLGQVLFDVHSAEGLRVEAALALGDVQLSTALATLTRAVGEVDDPALLEPILEGLGKRPYSETKEFFERYLEREDLPSSARVAALEALGNAAGDPTAALLRYASDPDVDVRAAAAWGLSATLAETEIGPQLVGLLQQENDAEVRARLYRALLNQEVFEVASVVSLSRNETDPAARLAAFDVLAAACHAAADPEVLRYFEGTVVAELIGTALRATDAAQRLASVTTLRRAGTPAALEALRQIEQQTTDRKLVEAAK